MNLGKVVITCASSRSDRNFCIAINYPSLRFEIVDLQRKWIVDLYRGVLVIVVYPLWASGNLSRGTMIVQQPRSSL